jgi:S1-C subfamily serine protease
MIARGGFLGVQCPPTSVIIDEVVPGGAAQLAELQSGDKILSINGVKVVVFEDLRKELANFADGEEVTIEYERRFQGITEKKVTLGRRPDTIRDR